jgi:undecaprenyl pyrophosphate phosphatase UppP
MVEVVGERSALGALGSSFWWPCLLGTVAAAFSGYWALRAVIRTLGSEVFHRFGWYCVPVGLLVIVLTWGGGS